MANNRLISEASRQENKGLVSSSETKAMQTDVVERTIGGVGKFQIMLCLAISPIKIAVGTITLSFVFMGAPTEFTCVNEDISPCSQECPGHKFNTSIFTKTIISEWDLVCTKSQMANVAQTTFMFGLMVGSAVCGFLADKYGRLKVMVWVTVIQGAAGVAASFAPWFWLFVLMRFLCATATSGNMTINFTYIMEVLGIKWRTLLGTVMQIPTNLGYVATAIWAYYIRDWRHFQLAISIPTIVLGGFMWMLPESPRWLLANGRTEQAIIVLEKAAKMNNLPTKNIAQEVTDNNLMKNDSVEKSSSAGNTLDLVRTPNMRKRSICIFLNWVICGLCFYGMAQFMGQIGNIFFNIAIPNLVQIPSDFTGVFFMNKFGRRFTVIMFYLISSACLLTIAILSNFNVVITSVLGGIGYVTSSICFSIIYFLTGEIFPTVVRNAGTGYASMFARVGSMSAPFIASLSSDTFWLTPLIFGLCPLLGAFLCYFLPETNGCELLDTIDEAEHYDYSKNTRSRVLLSHVNQNKVSLES